MESPSFTQQLYKILPLETHSWVLNALRQDQVVWQSLQISKLYEKALSTFGNRPLEWTPGYLSLLALNEELTPDFFNSFPLKPLEANLSQKAFQAYEKLTKGKSISELREEHFLVTQEATLDENKTTPSLSPVDALAEAGLIGLALREGLRLTGSWNNFAHEILGQSEDVRFWYTPLACVFSFIPEPIELLSTYIYPGAPKEWIALSLHAFLSNPLPLPDQINSLKKILSSFQTQDTYKPSEISVVLRLLKSQHQELARNFAEWLLEEGNLNRTINAEPANSLQINQVSESLHLAEIYQTAGKVDEALETLAEAQKTARRFQAGLSAYWATTAELGDSTNQSLILDAWKDAVAWTMTTGNSEGDFPFQSHLQIARLKERENGDIQDQIPELDEDIPSDSNLEEPEILLAKAQNAQQSGELAQAIQYACRAFVAVRKSSIQTEVTSFEPLQANMIEKRKKGLRELAKLLFELKLYSECVEILNLLLSTAPNDPELLFQLGIAHQASYQQKDANEAFQIALMLSPDRSDFQDSLAEGLEAIGDWTSALPERQNILTKVNPENREQLQEAYHALARCALRAGKLDLTSEACGNAISIDPEDGLAYFYLGEASYQKADIAASQNYYEQAVQLSPHLPEPWLGLAKSYKEAGEVDKSMDTLKEAVQAAPLSYEIHFALGEEYLSQGAQTQARMSFQKAYELVNAASDQSKEFQWKISLQLGKVLRQLGHIHEAYEVLEKAYQQAHSGGFRQPELAYVYAKTLLTLDKTSQAIPVLREVLQDDPQDITACVDYAKALLTTGTDAQDAIRVLKIALEKQPSLLEAQALLAEALSASGDHANALKAYQASLETELSKDRKWVARLSYGMGCSALASGYIDTAIAALQEAIHADPSHPVFHQKLCEAYWDASLYNNAIQAARSTINLATEDPNILLWFAEQAVRFYQLSIPKVKISDQEDHCEDTQPDRLYGIKPKQVLTEAMNALSQAALLAPQRADICLKLGELQIMAGEKMHAVETFHQVISKDMVTLDDLLATANWLTHLGETDATVACLERAVSLLKSSQAEIPCELLEDLSQAYLQNGDAESALETLRQAILSYPQNVDLYLKIAQIFIKSSRVEDALICLEDSLGKVLGNQDRAKIHYHLAQIQRSLGVLPKALANAEQALQLSESEVVNEKYDWICLAQRYLAAELARALLRTTVARSYLEGHLHALSTTEQSEKLDLEELNTLVGFYCLKSELALEFGEEIEAANALTPAVQVAPTHPRCLALQARFQHRRGDNNLALRTLDEALIQLPIPAELGGNGLEEEPKHPNNRYPNPHIPATEKSFTADDYLGVSEAAIELNLWELALHLVEKAISTSPEEPYLKLSLARILVRKAEQQYLCQSLEIIKHAPGENALASEQAQLFLKSIQATKQSLSNIDGVEGTPTLMTWEWRGRAIFENNTKENVDTLKEIDWSALPQNSDTATAQLIYLLRKTSDEQANVQSNSSLSFTEVPDPQEVIRTYLETASHISQQYPQSVLIQLITGLIFETVQPTQALKYAQQATKIQNPSLTNLIAMSHALLARLAFHAGIQELAAAAIDTALNIWPDEPRWNALAATISIQMNGATQEAIAYLETAAQLEPQNYAHFINLGLAYFQMAINDHTYIKSALQSFERSSRLEPNHPDAWFYMAEAYLLEGSSSSLIQAAALVDRSISLALSSQLKETPWRSYLLRAEIALKANAPEVAVQFTEKVLEHEPHHPKAAWLKAQALEILNRPVEALSVLEEATHTGDEPLPYQLKKAALLRQTQEPGVALKRISDIAEKNPDQPAVLSLLAQILSDAGQKEAAIKAAHLALQSYPDQADLADQEKARLHYMIGMQAVETGQLDNAIHHLHEAIQLDANFIEPYLELGFAFNKQRQYLKAQNIFHQATVIAPKDPRPFLHAGLALKEGKDYLSAETMLRRAAQIAPNDVQIRKHLAAVAALNLVHNPHNLHIGAER